jgi:hypothetical protein
MKLFTLLLLLAAALNLTAQKPLNTGAFEINPYLRYDKYPPINASTNPLSNQTLEIRGSGFGGNIFYHFPSQRKIHFRTGLGYYRYSFNNITSKHNNVEVGRQRMLNYVGMGDLIYTTDKYWYHTLTLSAGAQTGIVNRPRYSLNAGILAQYFFSFSQYYRIVEDAPAGPPEHRFNRKHGRGFAFSGGIDLNFLYHLAHFSIGPTVQLPIYDRWQQDEIFPGEEDVKSRSKWLRGLAPGLSIRYRL